MRSQYETVIAKYLNQDGVKYEYEPWAIQYFIRKSGTCADCGSNSIWVSRWYTPDFVLGNGIVIESKGFLKASDRTKMVAVKDSWPQLDIRFMFMRDNWCTSKRLNKYSDWAEDHGFKYHIGIRIPEDWINE